MGNTIYQVVFHVRAHPHLRRERVAHRRDHAAVVAFLGAATGVEALRRPVLVGGPGISPG
jgi:hypothetical protein